MRDPLTLIAVDQTGPTTFIAHYRFSAGNTPCNGRSEVTITQRQGKFYIGGIRALNGC